MHDSFRLFQALEAAWERDDLRGWLGVASRIEREDPFLLAYIGDIVDLFRAKPLTASWRDRLKLRRHISVRQDPRLGKAQESLLARAAQFANWQDEGNETIAAIRAGHIKTGAIRPHVRHPASAYSAFYEEQNRAVSGATPGKPMEEASHRPFALTGNIQHAFRVPLAVMHVEVLFAFAAQLNGQEMVTWLDVGCGRGEIANGANPGRFTRSDWRIAGSDLQAANIALANAQKTRGRSFSADDAFDLLREKREQGEHYDIISMFEFLEHLEDPLAFLRRVAEFEPRFVLAASPREQNFRSAFHAEPDRVHLWSYSREGWEQMFEMVGLTPVYASENLVGHYIGGLDWLTMIAGPKAVMREHRRDFRKAPPLLSDAE